MLNLLRNSSNNREIFNHDNQIAWAADDPATGAIYVALFNAADVVQTISMDLLLVNLEGTCQVWNVWDDKKMKPVTGKVSAVINPHGAVLFKLSKIE